MLRGKVVPPAACTEEIKTLRDYTPATLQRRGRRISGLKIYLVIIKWLLSGDSVLKEGKED